MPVLIYFSKTLRDFPARAIGTSVERINLVHPSGFEPLTFGFVEWKEFPEKRNVSRHS